MISYELDLLNYVFVVFLAIAAVSTPKDSQYKLINELLASKFGLFIGLHLITVSMGLGDGIYVDIYRAGLDTIFAFLFIVMSGYYLAFLCFSMAIFHILNTFMVFDYVMIMVSFQILQLMAASWGLIDGLIDRYFPCGFKFNFNLRHYF